MPNAGRVMSWQAERHANGEACIGCLRMEDNEEIVKFREVFEKVYNSANVLFVNPEYVDRAGRQTHSIEEEPAAGIYLHELIEKLRALENMNPTPFDNQRFRVILSFVNSSGEQRCIEASRDGSAIGDIDIDGYRMRSVLNLDHWKPTFEQYTPEVGMNYSCSIGYGTISEYRGERMREALGNSYDAHDARLTVIRTA